MNFIQKNWKGILVCLVMAVPCWLLGQRFPIVGNFELEEFLALLHLFAREHGAYAQVHLFEHVKGDGFGNRLGLVVGGLVGLLCGLEFVELRHCSKYALMPSAAAAVAVSVSPAPS